MNKPELWPETFDDETVEFLIPAIQEAIVATSPAMETGDTDNGVAAPDAANALAIVLATVLASSPACSTPQGMRKLAESAGRQLHHLMRDTHRLKQAAAGTISTLQ